MLPELEWNGTHLGILNKYAVLDAIKSHAGITYWKFRYQDQITFCMSRQVSSGIKASHQCIIDEVKAIFGLPKMGTHSVRWQNRTYLLSKVPMFPGYKNIVQEEFAMGRIPDLAKCLASHPEIKIRMQHLLGFWDIMGVRITENCALLRNFGTVTNAVWSPVGFRELRINPVEFGHFSQTMLYKWFDDISVPQAVARMLGVANSGQLYRKQTWLRFRIEEIFRRIDSKELHLVARIIERIINRVSQVLN